MSTNIHAVIRFLAEHIDDTSPKSRNFIRTEELRLDSMGELYTCGFRQNQWLVSLEAQLRRKLSVETGKPKSRLDELKEKRAKILTKVKRSRLAGIEESGAIARDIMREFEPEEITARVVHGKTARTLRMVDKLAIKATDRTKKI